MLYFLQTNNIKDMAGLEEKVEDMYGAQRGIAEELKPIDRRLKTLDEHISNAEKYFQYRDIYRQYKQQKPKKQEAFYESHRMELTHYEAAERYLNAVMNGKTGIPLKAWKTERDKLNGEKKQLTMANKSYDISQQERLFLLYKLFQGTSPNCVISFEQITDYLYKNYAIDVHPNTIHNDLAMLTSKHILPELQYSRKLNGYYIEKTLFEPYEIRLLVDSVQASSFITQAKAEDLTKKIKTLTDTKTASTLNRTAYVSGRTRSQNDRIIKETDEIYKAIATDRKLIFRYAKYTMEKKNGIYVKESSLRTVSPFALLWEKGKLYLYAYDEKRFRTYRVDRMESAKVHPTEMRTAKEEYKKTNLTKPTVKVFEMYDAPASIVRIRFRKELADAVIDQFGKDVMMIPQDEEHFTISVPVAVSPTFFAWIATLGHKAKIVEPAPVVEKMRDFLQRCSDMYLD